VSTPDLASPKTRVVILWEGRKQDAYDVDGDAAAALTAAMEMLNVKARSAALAKGSWEARAGRLSDGITVD
jgi:hypothetical protein